jgi:hypothetical protein
VGTFQTRTLLDLEAEAVEAHFAAHLLRQDLLLLCVHLTAILVMAEGVV